MWRISWAPSRIRWPRLRCLRHRSRSPSIDWRSRVSLRGWLLLPSPFFPFFFCLGLHAHRSNYIILLLSRIFVYICNLRFDPSSCLQPCSSGEYESTCQRLALQSHGFSPLTLSAHAPLLRRLPFGAAGLSLHGSVDWPRRHTRATE